jgi:hypothetical protein
MMIKTSSAGFVATAIMGIAAGACGQAATVSAPPENLPILKAGAQLRAADKPISIGHTASPEVIDWNNDGKKDLLVGTFEDGKVMLYLNRGTDAAPQFDQGQVLQAGGRDIRVGFG